MNASDETPCAVCGADATVEISDVTLGTDQLYSSAHKPELPIGKLHPRWFIKRWRMSPDSAISQALAAPKDSPEHQNIRLEVCDLGILGSDGACRYYLSILTGIDQFATWDDQFVRNVREYVVSHTCADAAQFVDDYNSVQFIVSFLRRAWERAEGIDHERSTTKFERAIELLLHHPLWSDEQIAKRVPTTRKQLARWSDYKGLRSAAVRRRARERQTD